jgi:DNA-directed RNA polymerase specialized sigma24 family protein
MRLRTVDNRLLDIVDTRKQFLPQQRHTLMNGSHTIPRWWDREFDKSGKPIRADVRASAIEIWDKVSRKARSVVGDATDAADLMERCVSRVSRSLDRRQALPFSQKTSAMLMVAFSRELSRHAGKLRRTQPSGDASAMEEYLSPSDWASEIESRLDLEKVVLRLGLRSRAILALRTAGYDWYEIASSLNVTVSVAKNSFWREFERARAQLSRPEKCQKPRHFRKAAGK